MLQTHGSQIIKRHLIPYETSTNLSVLDAIEPRVRGERPRTPDDFGRTNDMTLLLNRPGLVDELELWNVQLPERLVGETLPQFWYKKLQNPSTYRLARMGLDMCSIPAMSSDCERTYGDSKVDPDRR